VALSRQKLLVEQSLPKSLDLLYNSIRRKIAQNDWRSSPEERLWQEICLCILSSNVPYELAKSAHFRLMHYGVLDYNWILANDDAVTIIASELSKPNFRPLKKDGSGRKYRFPNIRAKNITEAVNSIYNNGKTVRSLLYEFRSEQEARSYLVGNVPGLGLKEASHLLRNIGYSTSLAIIDVHIISFLSTFGVIESNVKLPLKPRLYLELETIMQDISRHMQMNLAVLDNLIWHYMRNKKSS
jgi:N-glycosylase/DNA lyase